MQSSQTEIREDRDFVTSLARGLEVIRSFNAENPEMTLSEIAANTDLSAATVRRSLITLEKLGYVQRRQKRFLLTAKVLTLGASYLDSMNIKEIAQSYLLELVEASSAAASLTVLDGLEVVYIAHIPSKQRIRHGRSVGSRLPAYATSTGLVLLTYASERKREELYEAMPLRPYTSRTPVEIKELQERFKYIEQHGYTVACDTIEYGAIALAVPIKDIKGNVIAAINYATTTTIFSEEQIVEQHLLSVQECANKIGAMLGRYPALVHSVAIDL